MNASKKIESLGYKIAKWKSLHSYSPTCWGYKHDPRGEEYGGFSVYPQPDGKFILFWENTDGQPKWECTFPDFENLAAWTVENT